MSAIIEVTTSDIEGHGVESGQLDAKRYDKHAILMRRSGQIANEGASNAGGENEVASGHQLQWHGCRDATAARTPHARTARGRS